MGLKFWVLSALEIFGMRAIKEAWIGDGKIYGLNMISTQFSYITLIFLSKSHVSTIYIIYMA